MTIEAQTDSELDDIKEKIKLARAWAIKHFNAENAKDSRLIDENMNLVPPSFFVDFPSPDTMRAEPAIMGRRGGIVFEYRLHFPKRGKLYWQANHPFYGTPLPPLFIEEPQ